MTDILVKLHQSFKGKPKENIGKLVKIVKPYLKTPIVKECKESDLVSGILYKYQTGRYYKMIIENVTIQQLNALDRNTMKIIINL
jgi:hypothetical protein